MNDRNAPCIISRADGHTLIELLIGFAILTIVSMAFMQGISSIANMKETADTSMSVEKQINNIIENIRVNARLYQVAFTRDTLTRQAMLADKNLPIAWSSKLISDSETCPACPGRAGYVIQPLDGVPGLYIVTVRLTHTAWGGQAREYQFVVNP